MNTSHDDRRSTFELEAFYLFTSFFSGFVVMLVEIAGARLLSPIFGNSFYTWTALIGVVLFAISLGNAAGGWLADKKGAIHSLHIALFLSAIATFLLPTISLLIATSLLNYGPIMGPMIFSTALFVIPATAFGMVSPIALRLMSSLSRDKNIGFVGGLINSSSAIGSVAGTLCTGFVLLRYLGVNEIYYLTATLLLIVCVISMLLHKVRTKPIFIALASLLAVYGLTLSWSLKAVENPDVIYKKLSFYQLLLVVDQEQDGGEVHRMLIHDNILQGVLELETRKVVPEFQRVSRLLELHRKSVDDALIIGGGTFGVPQLMNQAWPQAKLTVLEIDQTVIDTAREYFYLDEYPSITPVATDARRYMNETQGIYDVVYIDAYSGWRSIPAHLTTQEFFQSVKSKLRSGGVGMMNIISRINQPGSELFDAFLTTSQSVFDEVQVYRSAEQKPGEVTNIYIIFGDSLKPFNSLEAIDSETAELLELYVSQDLLEDRNGMLLTDNLAPIEYLVSKTLQDR